MGQREQQLLLKVSGVKPAHFEGSVILPPSKSYLHRALFVSSLIRGKSELRNCGGGKLSDDLLATIRFLKAFGIHVNHAKASGSITVTSGGASSFSRKDREIFVGGSGTTARFALSFASIAPAGSKTMIAGDASLSKRPMFPLLDALDQLGVKYKAPRKQTLPIVIEGGGIEGGKCVVDGSISSQFVSSLLIACTNAKKDCAISISNPKKLVSKEYISSTVKVLQDFGFDLRKPGFLASAALGAKEYILRAPQAGKAGVVFHVPGDMSSAAALMGAAISSNGRVDIRGIARGYPQPDLAMIHIARKYFGARVTWKDRRITLNALGKNSSNSKKTSKTILDLKSSPDLVPSVFGIAAGLGLPLRISGIDHLRFKESDRVHTLARQFQRLGLKVSETINSLENEGHLPMRAKRRKALVLNPNNDHRMLMSFVIAGLSGNLGTFYIRDPLCINKSYPNFIAELKKLMHSPSGRQENILELLKINEAILPSP